MLTSAFGSSHAITRADPWDRAERTPPVTHGAAVEHDEAAGPYAGDRSPTVRDRPSAKRRKLMRSRSALGSSHTGPLAAPCRHPATGASRGDAHHRAAAGDVDRYGHHQLQSIIDRLAPDVQGVARVPLGWQCRHGKGRADERFAVLEELAERAVQPALGASPGTSSGSGTASYSS